MYWEFVFARVLAAILAGIALSNAGLLMQGVFQNPLVSPYTLGVSNGASFGCSFGYCVFSSHFAFLNLGIYLIPVFAFHQLCFDNDIGIRYC